MRRNAGLTPMVAPWREEGVQPLLQRLVLLDERAPLQRLVG